MSTVALLYQTSSQSSSKKFPENRNYFLSVQKLFLAPKTFSYPITFPGSDVPPTTPELSLYLAGGRFKLDLNHSGRASLEVVLLKIETPTQGKCGQIEKSFRYYY